MICRKRYRELSGTKPLRVDKHKRRSCLLYKSVPRWGNEEMEGMDGWIDGWILSFEVDPFCCFSTHENIPTNTARRPIFLSSELFV